MTALPAPANTRDHVLLSATLDVLTDLLTEVGAAAERTTVHLDGRTPSQPVVPNACARCFLATALTAGCTCFRRRSGNRIRRLATRAAVHWTRPAAASLPTATPAAITDPMRP